MCEVNYCPVGIEVYFGTETQQYFNAPLYGHYQLQPDPVNGKAYFKMNSYGFWWINGYWFIGYDSNKGESEGFAYFYNPHYNCPSQLSGWWHWTLWDGTEWIDAGHNLDITCNLPFCATLDGVATCPIGTAQCAHYDSSTTDDANLVPECSSLDIPIDHLGIPIPNIQEPNNCTNSVVQNCHAIPNPICNIAETAECEVGILTCDNREGLPPVCSVKPDAARILGTGLCTTGTLNLCASCEINNTVTCASGQTAVCSNYHSSSSIIPAPVCVNNANVPDVPHNGDPACNSGTISCNPIPAPTCTASNGYGHGQCSAEKGNAAARGVFTCTGRAGNEDPICSVVPGAVELMPKYVCYNGIITNCVGYLAPIAPACYTDYYEYPHCPYWTILTCDAASGAVLDQPPVCSRILEANPAASNTTDSPGLCSTTGTLQPCTILT